MRAAHRRTAAAAEDPQASRLAARTPRLRGTCSGDLHLGLKSAGTRNGFIQLRGPTLGAIKSGDLGMSRGDLRLVFHLAGWGTRGRGQVRQCWRGEARPGRPDLSSPRYPRSCRSASLATRRLRPPCCCSRASEVRSRGVGRSRRHSCPPCSISLTARHPPRRACLTNPVHPTRTRVALLKTARQSARLPPLSPVCCSFDLNPTPTNGGYEAPPPACATRPQRRHSPRRGASEPHAHTSGGGLRR